MLMKSNTSRHGSGPSTVCTSQDNTKRHFIPLLIWLNLILMSSYNFCVEDFSPVRFLLRFAHKFPEIFFCCCFTLSVSVLKYINFQTLCTKIICLASVRLLIELRITHITEELQIMALCFVNISGL